MNKLLRGTHSTLTPLTNHQVVQYRQSSFSAFAFLFLLRFAHDVNRFRRFTLQLLTCFESHRCHQCERIPTWNLVGFQRLQLISRVYFILLNSTQSPSYTVTLRSARGPNHLLSSRAWCHATLNASHHCMNHVQGKWTYKRVSVWARMGRHQFFKLLWHWCDTDFFSDFDIHAVTSLP